MYKVSLVQVVLKMYICDPTLVKTLLDRYNPIIDLTAEERIEATARRVGLNMPIAPRDNKAE
jgi:Complex1_LYR-like